MMSRCFARDMPTKGDSRRRLATRGTHSNPQVNAAAVPIGQSSGYKWGYEHEATTGGAPVGSSGMAMLRRPVMLLAVGLAAAIWGPWLGAGPDMMPGATRLDDAVGNVGYICIALWLVIVLRDVGASRRRDAGSDPKRAAARDIV